MLSDHHEMPDPYERFEKVTGLPRSALPDGVDAEALARWLGAVSSRVDGFGPSPAAPARCRYCSAPLVGRHGTVETPDGQKVSLHARCWRLVRIRLRVLDARPHASALRRLRSALADLEEARRIDPSSEYTRENLRRIRPLLRTARGHPVRHAFWRLVWLLTPKSV